MGPFDLTLHAGLFQKARLRPLTWPGRRTSWVELTSLGVMGFCAALACTLLQFKLRIPGHAILRSIFPMALGLALVPRKGSGLVMGLAAMLSVLGLRAWGLSRGGLGAVTSLCLTGPLLDLALRDAREGRRLYLGFALAGVGSNLLALAVHWSAMALGWERAGGRQFAAWWPVALGTYTLCGLLAGLLSALVWFHFRADHRTPSAGE